MRSAVVGLGVVLALVAAWQAAARQIAADLSSHEIEITAGFDGAELLLYGHADENTADVIVIVSGPDEETRVRRKERVAGVWVNRTEVDFPNAPGFYFVAVTDRLAAAGELDAILAETGLGARYLGLPPSDPNVDVETAREFREALIELRSRQRLYATVPGRIAMRDDGLFRTNVPFPAAVPVGTYQVTVYEVIDGWPVTGASTPLQVRKAGFSAFIFQTAREQPLLYGVIAILIALGAGWLGGYAFRR